MIQLTEILGFPVTIPGDDHLIVMMPKERIDVENNSPVFTWLFEIDGFIEVEEVLSGSGQALISRFGEKPKLPFSQDFIRENFSFFRIMNSVMPIPGYNDAELIFTNLTDLLKDEQLMALPASELARQFESDRSGFWYALLEPMMDQLIQIWRGAIRNGLEGTKYADRLVGAQSPRFRERMASGQLIEAGPLNLMIAYSTALMETKSSMGVVIAAPTAGACGGMPGTLIGLADHLGSDKKLADGFWTAGLVGLFIAMEATFAAEVAGCQAETGAGAAMAAAGLVEMMGGTALQAFEAASIALQNVMGLVCDPVANRVEIPCLGRNANVAGNALTSANMVLGGMRAVIPLDETIRAMLAVGRALPASLRCTAIGGLSDTPTARRLEAAIENPDYVKTSET
jgi:L-serine dehydratase